MELTKQDNQMAKGIAILGMLMLHLFCRLGEELPYHPIIWVGDMPLIYYLGLFGDICVPIYCFCSGYAQILLKEREKDLFLKKSISRLGKFLVNYWIILCVFSVLGLIFDSSRAIPGSVCRFLGNFFLVKLTYNGAWWFILTYIILILIAPACIILVKRLNSVVVFLVSGIIYFISYIFRFVIVLEFSNALLTGTWTQLVLLGYSQFAFVVGMIFYKEKLITKLRRWIASKRNGSFLCIIVPVILFGLHCIERSLIIAPITGLVTMLCFHLFPKPRWMCSFFNYVGFHSTNIWLVHMFFYLVLFKGFAFRATYPILIYALLFAVSLVTSYVVNILNAEFWKIVPTKKCEA